MRSHKHLFFFLLNCMKQSYKEQLVVHAHSQKNTRKSIIHKSRETIYTCWTIRNYEIKGIKWVACMKSNPSDFNSWRPLPEDEASAVGGAGAAPSTARRLLVLVNILFGRGVGAWQTAFRFAAPDAGISATLGMIADALAGAAAVAGATPPALMAFGGRSKTEAASLWGPPDVG